MATVTGAKGSGSKGAHSSVEARGFDSSCRLLDDASRRQIGRRAALGNLGKLFFGTLAVGVLGAAPKPVGADDKRVAKASAQAEPETVVTLEELQSDFERAKQYIIPLSSGIEMNHAQKRYNTKEHWLVVTETSGIKVQIFKGELRVGEEAEMVGDLHFPGAKLNEFTMMAIPFGDNNSLIQGELLVCATPMSLGTHFLDKTTGKPVDGIVELYEYSLPRGPAEVGVDIDNEGIAVMVVPGKGNRFAQVILAYVNNAEYNMGSSYTSIIGLDRPPAKFAKL